MSSRLVLARRRLLEYPAVLRGTKAQSGRCKAARIKGAMVTRD
jgi:hypothetical protein